MKALAALVKTELKLSLRGMDMVIFTIAMPVVIAVILGITFESRPAFPGAQYTLFEQSFGALASVGIFAAGIMGLPLVIADYRHKKILKRFRVTPVSPSMLLLAQVLVNMLFSLSSLLLVYGVAAVFFEYRLSGPLPAFMGSYLLVLLSIYSIGVLVAGVASSMKTANLLCVLLYFPMLIFSGATLPYELMPPALQKFADVLPLTQGIKLLKGAALGLPAENVFTPIAVMAGLAIVCILAAVRYFRWE